MTIKTTRMQDACKCAEIFLTYMRYKHGIHHCASETDLLAHPELHQPILLVQTVSHQCMLSAQAWYHLPILDRQ